MSDFGFDCRICHKIFETEDKARGCFLNHSLREWNDAETMTKCEATFRKTVTARCDLEEGHEGLHHTEPNSDESSHWESLQIKKNISPSAYRAQRIIEARNGTVEGAKDK